VQVGAGALRAQRRQNHTWACSPVHLLDLPLQNLAIASQGRHFGLQFGLVAMAGRQLIQVADELQWFDAVLETPKNDIMSDMERATARYDLVADFYLDIVGTEVTDPSAASLLDLLDDVQGMRVLDLACGHGRLARELARRGATVVGVDISDALLDRAREAEAQEPLGITYLKVDATSARALAGEMFYGIVCNHGLADIDDLDGTLATVARVLRPGGRFVFSILHPCFPGWDDDAPSSWPRDGGYYAEGWWLARNPGIRGKVGSNHRTFSTYLNSVVHHHLAIEEVAEPAPGPKLRARQLAAQPGAGPVPMFLVVCCRAT
jgi:2-polyprenyl-3-methyl-5-hydroxy-6-metoxy-1,4-benzoquinol methylase